MDEAIRQPSGVRMAGKVGWWLGGRVAGPPVRLVGLGWVWFGLKGWGLVRKHVARYDVCVSGVWCV